MIRCNGAELEHFYFKNNTRLVDGFEPGDVHKFNQAFKKKIPKGAEACNILIGQSTALKEDQKILAFVRLHDPIRGECGISVGM